MLPTVKIAQFYHIAFNVVVFAWTVLTALHKDIVSSQGCL